MAKIMVNVKISIENLKAGILRNSQTNSIRYSLIGLIRFSRSLVFLDHPVCILTFRVETFSANHHVISFLNKFFPLILFFRDLSSSSADYRSGVSQTPTSLVRGRVPAKHERWSDL